MANKGPILFEYDAADGADPKNISRLYIALRRELNWDPLAASSVPGLPLYDRTGKGTLEGMVWTVRMQNDQLVTIDKMTGWELYMQGKTPVLVNYEGMWGAEKIPSGEMDGRYLGEDVNPVGKPPCMTVTHNTSLTFLRVMVLTADKALTSKIEELEKQYIGESALRGIKERALNVPC